MTEEEDYDTDKHKKCPFDIMCDVLPDYYYVEEIITNFLARYPEGCLCASKCDQVISDKLNGSEIKTSGVLFVCDESLIFSSVYPQQLETLHELNVVENVTIDNKKLFIKGKSQVVTYEFTSKTDKVLSNVTSFFEMKGSIVRVNNNFIKPKKIKVVMLTIGSRGDVQPFICLALGMMARGYDVKIVTHSCFRDFVESHDIDFFPLSCDPKDLLKLCVNNTMFSVNFLRESFATFVPKIPTLLEEAWEGCRDANILISTPPALAGYHIAEKLKIRFINAFTMPCVMMNTQNEQNGWYSGTYNTISNFMTDQTMWMVIRKKINRWRRDVLRLPNKGYLESNETIFNSQKIVTLYCYSQIISPKHPDWNEYTYVTGYWRTNIDKSYKPDQSLVNFIKKYKGKCLLVSLGSIPVPNADEVYDVFITACRSLPEDKKHGMIICKGWSEAKIVSSDDILVCDELPFDIVIPHMKIVCHHGGAGTTGTCLTHKKPMIVMPFFGDQFYWGKCMQDCGIGIMIPYKELTQEKMCDAFKNMLVYDSPSYFRNAKSIGEMVAKEDGVNNAINIIEKNCDNSLIPPTFVPDSESLRCSNVECDKQFGYIKGKHHCRNCGGCFCDDCCKTKMTIPQFRYNEPVRVCSGCEKILRNKNLSAI